ncbi:MAG: cyclic nucleotide-binding domain-containing protein, partial [Methylococcaceae bacterium]|nr:cyclic nucleotide-binding domain-containing protein [Methylococcaceae bacterium]
AINQAWNGVEKCQLCPIREFALFADLKQDDFQLLHHPINEFELEAGAILYEQKDKIDFVYTIRSGLVKLVRYLPNGSYRIIRLLRQGDLAGIEALNGSAYLHHAIAMQNTSVCRIPVKNIDQLNAETGHLYEQLTARWQKVQNDADIWLADFTMGSSRNRVAKLLIYLATYKVDEAFYLPSREDIGALLAITPETSSRIIAEFKRAGLVSTQKNIAQINDSKLRLTLC